MCVCAESESQPTFLLLFRHPYGYALKLSGWGWDDHHVPYMVAGTLILLLKPHSLPLLLISQWWKKEVTTLLKRGMWEAEAHCPLASGGKSQGEGVFINEKLRFLTTFPLEPKLTWRLISLTSKLYSSWGSKQPWQSWKTSLFQLLYGKWIGS